MRLKGDSDEDLDDIDDELKLGDKLFDDSEDEEHKAHSKVLSLTDD